MQTKGRRKNGRGLIWCR